MSDLIKRVQAREILSGIGRPTVEVELWTERGRRVSASVPSGTSRGKYEAFELYDGGQRFRGLGVQNAVRNVNEIIGPAIIGRDVAHQRELDFLLLRLDGTEDKSRFGSNALLGVSLAVARAGAESAGVPLYQHLGDLQAYRLPLPVVTVLAGGKYSPSPLDFEDYLLVLEGFPRFADGLEALVATRQTLGELVEEQFGAVPDVGGALAPPIGDTRHAFDVMLAAIRIAGFEGRITLGLDVAGSNLRTGGGRYAVGGRHITAEEMVAYFVDLVQQYPLVFIEDPFDQDDFDSFAALTAALPDREIVGDDLFASNIHRLERGIRRRAGNTILLKANQIGTVTEVWDTGVMARENGVDVAVSIRSSDTNDPFVADLAVALHARQIKLGSPVRGERNAKYNRLLRIEEELGVQPLLGQPRPHTFSVVEPY